MGEFFLSLGKGVADFVGGLVDGWRARRAAKARADLQVGLEIAAEAERQAAAMAEAERQAAATAKAERRTAATTEADSTQPSREGGAK